MSDIDRQRETKRGRERMIIDVRRRESNKRRKEFIEIEGEGEWVNEKEREIERQTDK